MTMEAELGVTQLNPREAKDFQQTPEARRGKNGFSTTDFRGSNALSTT